MSSNDSRSARSFTTTGGVLVNVNDRFVPEPEDEPDPLPRAPRVIIVPEDQPAADREAFMRWLCREHDAFIEQQLRRHRDILPESAKDLHQRVLVIVADYVAKVGPLQNVRAFLAGVVRNEVRHHRRRWRPDVQQGAEVDDALASAPGPETDAARAEQRAKLERYMRALSAEEAEVVHLVDLSGLTLDEAAEAVGRPRGTVATQHARAKDKLAEMAAASARGDAAGEKKPKER